MSFEKTIYFNDQKVSPEADVYFIAEIGANFDGSLEKAKELCLAAKMAGAHCAKFQSFKAETIVSDRGFELMGRLKGVHGTWSKSVFETFKDVEFPRDWHSEVSSYCRQIGIHFSTSPYDFDAVDLCVELDVPFIKIGSGEITWLKMIEKVAATMKPIILSTGDATLAEIDEAIRVIKATGNKQLVLLQCITNYPSMIESANIRVLDNYKLSFDTLVGYSDHSPGDLVTMGAVAKGACVIEKHFTLDKKSQGPDHPHSMEPSEFREMIDRTLQLKTALGSSVKVQVKEEEETVFVQRRSLYFKREMIKGQIIKESDLVCLRPAIGIMPKYEDLLVGKTVKKDVKSMSPVKWDDVV